MGAEQSYRRETWFTAKYPHHNSHVLYKKRLEAEMGRNLEYAASVIAVKDPKGNIDKFARHMQKPNAAGIVIANHDQHVNLAAFLNTLKIINDQSPREIAHHLLVTLSLINGDQGLGFQRFALGMLPTLQRNKMDMIAIMREKDKKEFYVSKGMSEEEAGKSGKKSKAELDKDKNKVMANVRRAREGLIKGELIWFFPAGTTIEGTIDKETGKDHGMEVVESPLLASFMSYAAKNDKDVMVLALSLNGHNNIVPARQEKPTQEARDAIKSNKIWGWFLEPRYLAEVVVQEPFGLNELAAAEVDLRDGDAVNTYAMRLVAKGMDPKRRGVYA